MLLSVVVGRRVNPNLRSKMYFEVTEILGRKTILLSTKCERAARITSNEFRLT